MSRKNQTGTDRFFRALIALLCVLAIALVLAGILYIRLNPPGERHVPVSAALDRETVAPMTLASAQSPTPPVETTPAPTQAPLATNEPYEKLPVYNSADTQARVIAITLDDCTNIAQLRNACTAARTYGAKLTLFPYGNMVMTSSMTEALQFCVFNMGFEIENRTMSNGLLYSMEDALMASEIWSTDRAVDYALSKDYGMHLLRTRSNLGTADPRTNDYLRQLGYDGFVGWSVNGINASSQTLINGLKPGAIYLFSTTPKDVQNMAQLMQYARDRGYQMVTVSELLGFGPVGYQEETDDILSRQMPSPTPYAPKALQFSEGDRAWQVALIQRRLIELGYLSGSDADGVFGSGTTTAISLFQAQCGQLCTGIATVELQQQLFADNAPASPNGAGSLGSGGLSGGFGQQMTVSTTAPQAESTPVPEDVQAQIDAVLGN